MTLKILILGCNGFIGSSLVAHILNKTDWHVFGLDLRDDHIRLLRNHDRFNFLQADMCNAQDWIAQAVAQCDVVLPLVAIATPATYIQDPLRVFELDFLENLSVVRYCVQHGKRVVFPSSSEVYGMCSDEAFDEQTSNLVMGPIDKQRWIYACSKQMLDRVIHAYGLAGKLRYTLFRPFNWIGPRLDVLQSAQSGGSRVVTQFINNVIHEQPISLVDGGVQRRCFLDIEDGISGLMQIIENHQGVADQRIFNLGYPENDYSIAQLAHMILELCKTYPDYAQQAQRTQIITVTSEQYYGHGYQDVTRRVPSIKNAQNYLGWQPRIDLQTSLKRILDYQLISGKYENIP